MEITLIKSAIAQSGNVKATLKALGMRRIGTTVTINTKNDALMGMVRAVSHCLKISGEEEKINKPKKKRKKTLK